MRHTKIDADDPRCAGIPDADDGDEVLSLRDVMKKARYGGKDWLYWRHAETGKWRAGWKDEAEITIALNECDKCLSVSARTAILMNCRPFLGNMLKNCAAGLG